jgi:hypothetical protein
MAKETVRIAAMAAAIGFLVIAAFQGALALGAPLGFAAWGGAYDEQLPMGLRIASGVAVGVWVLAVLIVLGRRVSGRATAVWRPPMGDVGTRRPAVCGSSHEHRVVERMGALRLGTHGADPGSPVLLRRAQSRTGFRERLREGSQRPRARLRPSITKHRGRR